MMKTTIKSHINSEYSTLAIDNSSVLIVGDEKSLYWQLQSKRFIDIMGASAALLISLPLWVLIAVIIKSNSKGPVFFKQKRIRELGNEFEIFKFRTMHHYDSAEDHKAYIKQLLQDGDPTPEERDRLLKEYTDFVHGKVTKIGKLLRETSLDELPQFWNIFKGEMSLVGPRPHPTYEVSEYKDWYHRRHQVKPGLTGWSKINLRLTPKNYEEAIKFDLWYVDHWTLWFDMKILFKTIPFIFFNRDAK